MPKFDTKANWNAIKCVCVCLLCAWFTAKATISIYTLKLVVSVFACTYITFSGWNQIQSNVYHATEHRHSNNNENGTLSEPKIAQAKTQNAFQPPFKIRSVVPLLLFVHWNHIICVWVNSKAVKRYIQAPTKMFSFLLYDWKVPFFGAFVTFFCVMPALHDYYTYIHVSMSPVRYGSVPLQGTSSTCASCDLILFSSF